MFDFKKTSTVKSKYAQTKYLYVNNYHECFFHKLYGKSMHGCPGCEYGEQTDPSERDLGWKVVVAESDKDFIKRR